jgi:hypothetical protein
MIAENPEQQCPRISYGAALAACHEIAKKNLLNSILCIAGVAADGQSVTEQTRSVKSVKRSYFLLSLIEFHGDTYSMSRWRLPLASVSPPPVPSVDGSTTSVKKSVDGCPDTFCVEYYGDCLHMGISESGHHTVIFRPGILHQGRRIYVQASCRSDVPTGFVYRRSDHD